MKDENKSGYIKSVLLPSIAFFFRKIKDGFCAEKVFSILFILSFFVVIAGRDISYTDQSATEIRKAARLQTIAPVFMQDMELVSETLKKYDEFVSFMLALYNDTEAIFDARVQEQYPGLFDVQVLKNVQKSKQFDGILTAAQAIVKQAMAVGIAEFPEKDSKVLTKRKSRCWYAAVITVSTPIFSQARLLKKKIWIHILKALYGRIMQTSTPILRLRSFGHFYSRLSFMMKKKRKCGRRKRLNRFSR